MKTPAPASNLVMRDYALSGPNLRRAIWRKAAALERKTMPLCDPLTPVESRRIWAGIQRRIVADGSRGPGDPDAHGYPGEPAHTPETYEPTHF